jgi:tetratricopeptide (TPR) repeat protein
VTTNHAGVQTVSAAIPVATQALIARCDALLVKGDWRAAEAEAASAVRAAPADANAHYVLGGILGLVGRLDDAEAATREALRLDPLHAGAFSNLGAIAAWRQDYAAAVRAFRRSLALGPDTQDARAGLAYALLASGEFHDGWAEHERARPLGLLCYDKSEPRLWDGSPLPGATLALFGESGLGDVVQFTRLARLARERLGRVVLYLQPYYAPLVPLLASLDGIDEVSTDAAWLRRADVCLSVFSLTYLFDVSLDESPVRVPYLAADPARRERFRTRLGPPAAGRRRVGLVWGGHPRLASARINALDRRRSIPLSMFAPLLDVADIEFHSLQHGEAARELAGSPLRDRLHEHDEAIRDYADTAALMCELDLVITVDTSVAHVAGALGRPVWMLNRFDSCWRWGPSRADAPWYPSMRIFRQPRFGDWAPAIRQAAEALSAATVRDQAASAATH